MAEIQAVNPTIAAITLEPLAADHLDGIMSWINDPAVTFYFANFGKDLSREEEAAYIEKMQSSSDDRLFSAFGDVDLQGAPASLPRYLGQFGLSQIYWPARTARLGVMMPAYAGGHGVAARACQHLLERAFGELGLNKVWLIVRSDNAKGLHLWTKVGFRCEGVLKQEYWAQGRYFDMLRMAILASEFAVS